MRTIVLTAAAAMLMALPAQGSARPAHRPTPIAAAIADVHRGDADRALDESRKPADVLAFAGFKPGQTVADWGAGGGYYSRLIADVVGPKGRVYAILTPAFTKKEAWDKLTRDYTNVLPMMLPVKAQTLAPASLDAIFAHLEYHDLYFASEKYDLPPRDVDAVLRNWFAAVKPGGSVVIVDHVGPAGDPRDVVEKFHRIDPARVRTDLERAGFVFEAESDVLRRNEDPHDVGVFDPSVRGKTDRFTMRFRRPA